MEDVDLVCSTDECHETFGSLIVLLPCRGGMSNRICRLLHYGGIGWWLPNISAELSSGVGVLEGSNGMGCKVGMGLDKIGRPELG